MLQNLVSDIIQKRELKDIDRLLAERLVEEYVATHPKLREKIKLPYPKLKRSKEYKEAVKEIRSLLREIYGVFKLKGFETREELLEEIKSIGDIESHNKILKLHKSTAERLPYYDEVYSTIFKITGKVNSILDLGCGLNPFSYPYIGKKVKYIAAELSEADAKFVQRYFDKFKIDGEAFAVDLTRLPELPEVAVCFMFKLLDTLESLKRDVSKELLKKVKAKWLVVSFSTKSIGGRKTISKKRLVWFEKLIKGKKYETFEIENEFFYVVRL